MVRPTLLDMHYLDASFLIAYLVPEEETVRTAACLDALTGPIALSHWTETECASALAKKVRERRCTSATMNAVLDQIAVLVDEHFLRWLPSADDHAAAIRYMGHPRSGLRAGDALHLAIAANRQATLLTLDRHLLAAARVLKLPARSA